MSLGTFTRRKNLFMSVFIVNLVYFSAGVCLTWTSPSIPYLKSPNPILVINDFESSIIVTCNITGQIFGSLLCGILTAHIGRKWSIFVTICMFLLQWLLLGLALNLGYLIVARLLGGAAVAIVMGNLPMYVAEISEGDNRSVLNSFPFASRALGYLLCYSVGPFVSYRLLIYICAISPVILIFLVLLLPESPYYLIDKGQKEKAFKELSWLRGTDSNKVREEIDVIQGSKDKVNTQRTTWRQFLKSPTNIKAFCYSLTVRSTQEFTGITVILYLLQTIFISADVPVSSSISPIIIGIVFFIAGCISPIVVNSYGYKKPFVVSVIGIVFSLIVLGLHYYLISHGYWFNWFKFVPLACLIVYAISYAVGIINTSFAIVGEIFALNVKSLGTSISNSLGFLMGDLTVIYYYVVSESYGSYTVMWTYSLLISIGGLFVAIYIPETSKMSLEEIQQYLRKSTKKTKKKSKYYLDTISEDVQV